MKVHLAFLMCGKCGETWIPRTKNPKKCPTCQTRYWGEKNGKRNK